MRWIQIWKIISKFRVGTDFFIGRMEIDWSLGPVDQVQVTFLVTHCTDRHAPIPRLLQYGTLYKWTQANQNTVWRSLGETFSMRCRDT